MGLILKYVEHTKAGSWQYRRRVPKDVSPLISKREFKRKLGDSEREALKAWSAFHAQVEREIEAARKGLTHAIADPSTALEAYQLARQHVKNLETAGFDQRDKLFTAEEIIQRYPVDPETDTPIGASLVDTYTINMLRGGLATPKAPEPTLNDARHLYLKEHLRADQPETDSRVTGFTNRVIDAALQAMGGDRPLSRITREDARNIRDHMLDRIKETGRGVGGKVSAATVSRELSIISAVFNFAIREFDLGAVQNPFSNLPVARSAKGKGQKALEKRDPLPDDVLEAARQRVLERCKPELSLIWRILEGTGCRLAEVTGLLVSDVSHETDLPFIRIEANAARGLKTESSRRVVPLVGDALFPTYGKKRGSDSASAALIKQLRRVTLDEKHVIHSLRHNMKDKLIEAEVSSIDQNLILGHALTGVGDRTYGGETARLRAITKAMQKALGLRGGSRLKSNPPTRPHVPSPKNAQNAHFCPSTTCVFLVRQNEGRGSVSLSSSASCWSRIRRSHSSASSTLLPYCAK